MRYRILEKICSAGRCIQCDHGEFKVPVWARSLSARALVMDFGIVSIRTVVLARLSKKGVPN